MIVAGQFLGIEAQAQAAEQGCEYNLFHDDYCFLILQSVFGSLG